MMDRSSSSRYPSRSGSGLLVHLAIAICAQSPTAVDAFASIVRPANNNPAAVFAVRRAFSSFSPSGTSTHLTCRRHSSGSSSSTSLSMCICINCARVTSCQGYHFVESMHNQPHMDENPTFEPQDGSPTIHATSFTVSSDRAESEFERMMREHKAEEDRAEAAAKAGGGDAGKTCEVDEDGQPFHGEERYDLCPVTTVEYDVVACADYVEDMGAWVRNMPEEIRKANPNFVPT